MSCDNNLNNNEDKDGNGKQNVETWIGHKNISNMFKTVPSICSSNLNEVVVVGGEEAGPSEELPSTLLLPSSSTVLTPRSSTEDLSEYTDADESISAPTEFLAEFLSAVMMRDFTTALKYCKLILQYEPNNVTAKEFYPLIIEKIKTMSDENDTSSESSAYEDNSDATSVSGEKHNNEDSDATTASYSSLEDEEVDSRAPGNNETTNLSQLKYSAATNGNGSCVPSQPHLRQHKGAQQQQQQQPPIVSSFVVSSSDSESPTEPISQQMANV